jgi:hypothetical protein
MKKMFLLLVLAVQFVAVAGVTTNIVPLPCPPEWCSVR